MAVKTKTVPEAEIAARKRAARESQLDEMDCTMLDWVVALQLRFPAHPFGDLHMIAYMLAPEDGLSGEAFNQRHALVEKHMDRLQKVGLLTERLILTKAGEELVRFNNVVHLMLEFDRKSALREIQRLDAEIAKQKAELAVLDQTVVDDDAGYAARSRFGVQNKQRREAREKREKRAADNARRQARKDEQMRRDYQQNGDPFSRFFETVLRAPMDDDKLTKIFRMAGSDHEGEATNALSLFKKNLEASGKSMGDVVVSVKK